MLLEIGANFRWDECAEGREFWKDVGRSDDEDDDGDDEDECCAQEWAKRG